MQSGPQEPTLRNEPVTLGSPSGERLTVGADTVLDMLKVEGGTLTLVNCDIDGLLAGSGATLNRAVVFENCTVAADLSAANCKQPIILRNCTVHEWKSVATLFERDLTIDDSSLKDVAYDDCVFQRNCTISKCRLGDGWWTRSTFGGSLSITGCTGGAMNVDAVKAGGDITFDDSSVSRISANAIDAAFFRAVSVRCDQLELDRAILKAAALLERAEIKESLHFRDAVVGGEIMLAGLNADFVALDRSSCKAVLLIHEAQIAGAFNASNAGFGGIEIHGGTVAAVRINDTIVNGHVSIRGAAIDGAFSLQRSSISGSIRIGAPDSSTVFRADARFMGTAVSAQFVTEHTEFRGEAVFTALRAKDIYFANTTFQATVDISGVSAAGILEFTDSSALGEVAAEGASAGMRFRIARCNMTKINLFGLHSGVDASFRKTAVKILRAQFCHIVGPLILRETTVSDELDLTGARIGALSFGASLVKGKGTFEFPRTTLLHQCQYDLVRGSWTDLQAALTKQENYDGAAFRQLESSLRGVGRTDWADSVYFSGKRRARGELPRHLQMGQLALEWSSGYGAKPLRLLVASAVIAAVIVGLVLIAMNADSSIAKSGQGGIGGVLFAAADLALRGEKATIFSTFIHPEQHRAAIALLDGVLLVRYALVLVLGIFIAYLTGLIRYVGTK